MVAGVVNALVMEIFVCPSTLWIRRALVWGVVLLGVGGLVACKTDRNKACSGTAVTAAGRSGDDSSASASRAKATFAGGCFWCMEAPFDKVDGVLATVSGYTGGTTKDPTYKQVAAGVTGHAEAIQITFDPKKVSYSRLLDLFWRNIDPLDGGGQFCDRGSQYRSAIYVADEAQRKAAEQSLKAIEARLGQKVKTELTRATTFYRAEEYHQDFYCKSPARYYTYRKGCGRDARLDALWGEEKSSK